MTDSDMTWQRVWDLPVRIIHWLIVVLLGLCWWSAETLQMDIHRYGGFGLLGVVVFRLYWGIAGTRAARFSNFVRGPRITAEYFRSILMRDVPAYAGHNPLGGWSVVLLLLLLMTQVLLGLFAVDVDGWEAGPLNQYVSFEFGRLCAEWHEIIFNTLLIAAAVHVIAIAYYYIWRRQNLVSPMLHGRKKLAVTVSEKQPHIVHFVIASALASLAVWTVASL